MISSTAGLEAALVGKPVLIFGDYPWDYAPSVRRAEALAQLPRQLRELAANPLGVDHPDVLAFGASWDRSLPRGRYFTKTPPHTIGRSPRMCGALPKRC